VLDGLAEVRAERVGGWRGGWFGTGRLGLLTDSTPAQKVDATIVSNAKQPRPQGTCIVERVEFSIGLEECLLNDILAIQHGSRHPRAVAVQARTQVRDRLEKGQIPRLEGTTSRWGFERVRVH
jgi:hypothetical protein